MKELYVGHYENALKAQKLAVEALKESKELIRNEYYTSPNKCIQCNSDLDFYKRKNKFCGSSCSAIYNNTKREGHKQETKDKIAKSLLGRVLSQETRDKILSSLSKTIKFGSCKIKYTNCKICDKLFTQRNYNKKVTCSNHCRIEASTNRKYRNGSRKTIKYKNLTLESSWELKVAIYLDENNVEWVRPKPFKWKNSNGKDKLYYPDFYLPNYNLFLDPKNPHCMEIDKEKMEWFSKEHQIVFGDINYLIGELNKLINKQTKTSVMESDKYDKQNPSKL
jgi:hypothetical protein